MEWTIEETTMTGNVVIVGCGGTGGFVAEGVCRLLLKNKVRDIILIDPDLVEDHNLRRQNFYEGDIGRFKSEALAERLSRRYGRRISYSVQPWDREMSVSLGGGLWHPIYQDIIVGCVDRAPARASIAASAKNQPMGWWIDAGNGKDSGQVLVGNAQGKWLEHSFTRRGAIRKLPLPTVQRPELLVPAPDEDKPRDCARAVEDDDQDAVINQAMAALVVTFIDRLVRGKLQWMAAYLDLGRGSLSTVPATPEKVAAVTGLTKRQLMEKGK